MYSSNMEMKCDDSWREGVIKGEGEGDGGATERERETHTELQGNTTN
jgi:hypothetical protein